MFEFETAWWEVILRVSIIYIALLFLVRLTGKRQLGQLSPMDLLTVLLLAETVSPALTGHDYTLASGLLAAATLLVLTYLNGWISYRWRSFEAVTEGTPKVLIRHGSINEDVMRSERVTEQELQTALRRHGLAATAQVAMAMIEPDGELTFLVKQRPHRTGTLHP